VSRSCAPRSVLALPVGLSLVAGSVLSLSGCASAPASPAGPAVSATALVPKGPTVAGVGVLRVVDGDTIHVLVRGQDVTVRMIGIDTPETVKPDTPVQCFGPEASEFAKRSLTDQTVTLEFDASQGSTDRYGRTLAYVWLELPDGGRRLFNLDAVAGGYAEERQYGSVPFAWQSAFRTAEQQAQSADAGRWGACPRS
jgi:micrococcal nuclease